MCALQSVCGNRLLITAAGLVNLGQGGVVLGWGPEGGGYILPETGCRGVDSPPSTTRHRATYYSGGLVGN